MGKHFPLLELLLPFLMYRVELKVSTLNASLIFFCARFLMYRVELKVIWRKIQIGSGRSS